MADDLDAMLQGQDDSSAPASQAQTGSQSIDPGQGQIPPEQQSLEEAEFNKLSGSTQDRIKSLVQRARSAEEKVSRFESGYNSPPPPPPGYNQTAPEVADALRKLSDAGVATDEKVDRKINQGLTSLRYEFELERLQSKYGGDEGEPQFVREEYEDYVQQHPQYRDYLPEDVFKYKMFPEEFRNLDIQKASSPKTGATGTLKPSKTSIQQEVLTPEYIEDRLKQPDAQQWYSDHFDQINAVLSKAAPQ